MDISIKEQDGVMIFDMSGRLDTNTTPKAEKTLTTEIGSGPKKVLVDFTNLDYTSSAGLRLLLTIAKNLKKSGGELVICGLNEVVQEIFDISGFDTILNVKTSKEEAINSFS